VRASLLAAAVLVLLVSPRAARAYNTETSGGGGQTATSFGGRATFYKPNDADHGLWSPGVDLRLHLNKAYAAEFSADFTHHSIGPTTINVIPFQATILGYFYPDSKFSPYLLVGLGWYYTRVRDFNTHTDNRWGPHAGLGLSYLLGDRWTVDGSYRWLWSQTYNVTDASHPVGKNFSGRGHMITLGLSLHL
jgi:opacity protein-like surface antigen